MPGGFFSWAWGFGGTHSWAQTAVKPDVKDDTGRAEPPCSNFAAFHYHNCVPAARGGQRDMGLGMNNSPPGNKTSSLKTDRALLSICCQGPAWERCQGGAGAAGGSRGQGDAPGPRGRDLSATCCRVSWVTSLNPQGLFSLNGGCLPHHSPHSVSGTGGRGARALIPPRGPPAAMAPGRSRAPCSAAR